MKANQIQRTESSHYLRLPFIFSIKHYLRRPKLKLPLMATVFWAMQLCRLVKIYVSWECTASTLSLWIGRQYTAPQCWYISTRWHYNTSRLEYSPHNEKSNEMPLLSDFWPYYTHSHPRNSKWSPLARFSFNLLACKGILCINSNRFIFLLYWGWWFFWCQQVSLQVKYCGHIPCYIKQNAPQKWHTHGQWCWYWQG